MTPSQRLLIAINLSVTAMSVMQGYYRFFGPAGTSPASSVPPSVAASSPSVISSMPFLSSIFGGSASDRDLAGAGLPCPHPNFMRRHLCEFCSSDKDAYEFSQRRTEASNVNSVMFGYPGFYRADARTCLNQEPVRVVTCTMSTGRCLQLGNKCTVQHNSHDGQLDYHNITCT